MTYDVFLLQAEELLVALILLYPVVEVLANVRVLQLGVVAQNLREEGAVAWNLAVVVVVMEHKDLERVQLAVVEVHMGLMVEEVQQLGIATGEEVLPMVDP